LGAVVIGTYTDRTGRKAGLTLSIGLMMIGTTLMVVTPGYATIGIAAPLIIMLARMLQGFSVGGEFGSAVAFLVEHGGDRKGFSASWQWTSTGIVSVIVALFGIALTTSLSHEELVSWGWRIPYVFGLLIGPAGLYIRSKVVETSEFTAAKPHSVPLRELLQQQPLQVVLALGASIVSNASYYLLLYIPTYAIKTLHLHASTGFIATLVGGVALAVCSLLAGYWSDKTDRSRIMLWTAVLFLVTAYPVFWLMVAYPSLATAVFAVGWLNLVKGGYSGVLPSLMSERFPVETRAVGIAFSYSISVTVFGGFAPFFATILIAQTGDPLSPSYYLMFTALLSIAALLAIRRQPASGR
jgi:MHS family proline/betaine transporter-like MFS transporter